MDSKRFSPNNLPPEAVGTGPQMDPERLVKVARQTMEKCIHNIEASQSHSLGTLYCGGLGPCVYLRLRFAQRVKSTNQREARQLLERALLVARNALGYEESRLQRGRSFRVSLLEGSWVGAKSLLCVLLHELGKHEDAGQLVDELINVLRSECDGLARSECEVLYGRAGALHAILFLRRELNDRALGKDLVISLSRAIINEGRETAQCYPKNNSMPLLWEWHGKAYLGAAHGVVGILHTLLCLEADEFSILEGSRKIPVRQLIRKTVDGLDENCYPSGNLRSSMDTHGGDRLVHWCHGAPGHVMLLIKAAERFQDNKYIDQAKSIAYEVIWKRGLLRKGVGLCHGISGNGYTLLSVARCVTTPAEKQLWIHRATQFACFAVDSFQELELVPDRPYSLYEGAAAMGALLLDLVDPQNARFPLYE